MSDKTAETAGKLLSEIAKIDSVSLPDATITELMDKQFIEDLGFDSLDLISFYFKIEEEFGTTISEEDIDSGKVSSFGGLVHHIIAN